MKVVQLGSYTWTLLQEGDDLILDVLCSHSAADYPFVLKLNAAEADAYRAHGGKYLDELAQEIHYSAPGVVGSRSRYASRKLTGELCARVNAAIRDHLKDRAGQ